MLHAGKIDERLHALLSEIPICANDDSKAYGCALGEERIMQRVTLASDGKQVT